MDRRSILWGAQNIGLKDLLPSFISADRSGVSASPSWNRRATSICGRDRTTTQPTPRHKNVQRSGSPRLANPAGSN
ncbi:hypothetical protein J6500_25095 [Bradyrhizobium sp. WSM 1704]|uniref:hypothetical protein n=1 Tax=Bradyrhizobium semiaridum TaxID=2821404 RepID=UPI001CE28B39|nr:hypothetical protein [Bradyrhizobium semiaridum]MCA6125146.1 hypothetical protein [Bradyrhizobium semiaridum]